MTLNYLTNIVFLLNDSSNKFYIFFVSKLCYHISFHNKHVLLPNAYVYIHKSSQIINMTSTSKVRHDVGENFYTRFIWENVRERSKERHNVRVLCLFADVKRYLCGSIDMISMLCCHCLWMGYKHLLPVTKSDYLNWVETTVWLKITLGWNTRLLYTRCWCMLISEIQA